MTVPPLTIGIEEEYLLLDPSTGVPVAASAEVRGIARRRAADAHADVAAGPDRARRALTAVGRGGLRFRELADRPLLAVAGLRAAARLHRCRRLRRPRRGGARDRCARRSGPAVLAGAPLAAVPDRRGAG